MKKFLTLFQIDLRRTSVWLKKHSIAKLLVFLAFLVVIFVITATIFWGSYSYFWSIKYLEPYGRLTASYVLHSGLIVSLWFVFFSSLVQSYKSLINPNSEMEYILKQPINNFTLSSWFSLRSTPINSFLMLIFWFPVSISYNHVFGSLNFWQMVTFIFLVTFLITFLIENITLFITMIATPLFHKFTNLMGIVGASGFIFITWLMIKLMFPPSLNELIRIEIEQFDKLFASLPLNQNWLLTKHIITFIEGGQFTPLIVPLIAFIVIVSFLSIINSKVFKYSWQHNLAISNQKSFLTPPTTYWFSNPHFWKETVILFRDRGERNAILFFTSLIFFFFYFLNRSLVINQELSNNIDSLAGFSLGAILFISTAFLLRTVFPILSKEGTSAWFLLRETKNRINIHQQKSAYSRFLIIFIFITTNIGWVLMPLEQSLKQNMLIYSSIGIVLLGWLNTNMGLMMTEWEKGSDPDQISTSGTGIITLILSILLIAGMVISFLGGIASYLNIPILIISIGIMMLIQRISQNRTQSYQYPQAWK